MITLNTVLYLSLSLFWGVSGSLLSQKSLVSHSEVYSIKSCWFSMVDIILYADRLSLSLTDSFSPPVGRPLHVHWRQLSATQWQQPASSQTGQSSDYHHFTSVPDLLLQSPWQPHWGLEHLRDDGDFLERQRHPSVDEEFQSGQPLGSWHDHCSGAKCIQGGFPFLLV